MPTSAHTDGSGTGVTQTSSIAGHLFYLCAGCPQPAGNGSAAPLPAGSFRVSSAAALARAVLFIGGKGVSAGATLPIGTTLWTARGPRWTHLRQLLQLIGCQDFLHLDLHLGLQIRHLFQLVGGQFQYLLCARGQHVKPWATETAGTTFGWWRTLSVAGWGAVLCRQQAGRSAECQREQDYFRFHDVMWLLCFFPRPPSACLDAEMIPVGARKECRSNADVRMTSLIFITPVYANEP